MPVFLASNGRIDKLDHVSLVINHPPKRILYLASCQKGHQDAKTRLQYLTYLNPSWISKIIYNIMGKISVPLSLSHD